MDTKTTIRLFDRVRRPVGTVGVPSGSIGTVVEIDEPNYRIDFGNRVIWMHPVNFEFHERAHYAPDGVAVLALTPEVLKALAGFSAGEHDCAEFTPFDGECYLCADAAAFLAAIAAAEKEAKK